MGGGSDLSTTNSRQANAVNYNNTNNVGHRQYDPEPPTDGNINAILEVCHQYGSFCFIILGVSGFHSVYTYGLLQEEEALIAAHRKEIEDTMEIVREVSKLALISGEIFSFLSTYEELAFIILNNELNLPSLLISDMHKDQLLFVVHLSSFFPCHAPPELCY